MTTQTRQRLITVTEYEQMIEAGVLGEDERLELLGGAIVTMSPIGSRHAACVKRLNLLLVQRLGTRAIVGVQDPIRLDDVSEPEPDIVLLAHRADFYAEAHPGPEDALLIIEVADTSLEHDRTVKLPLYAQAEIPEVWLVDLTGNAIDVYSEPSEGTYLLRRRYLPGQEIALLGAGEQTVAVSDVLV